MPGVLIKIKLDSGGSNDDKFLYPKEITPIRKDIRAILYIHYKDGNETIKIKEEPTGSPPIAEQKPIKAFFLQLSVKTTDGFYVNIGMINLTSALYSSYNLSTEGLDFVEFKNPHIDGTVRVESNHIEEKYLGGKPQLAIEDVYLEELEADRTLYQTHLESVLKRYSPRVLGSYDLNFARQVHLFYAPSELSYKDGRQVKLNPSMHFLRHRTFEAKLLKSLAQLAFISTYAYDGNEKRIVDFQNVSALSGADACFATQVFSRYLALLPNLVKYEYDYDFVFKKDPTRRISDMFGDCLLNFTGDCEDASRLVADIWRATAEMETDDPFLKCMKQVQAQFDLYCTLCTIQSNANMAHCTCILVPIGGQKSAFPFAIVEGTNAISPFAATGMPEELSRKADMKMLGQYEKSHDEILKDENEKFDRFNTAMQSEHMSDFHPKPENNNYSLFFLSVKPTRTTMDQKRVGEKDNSGRAESVVSWYGLFHEGFRISSKIPDAPPEPFLFVKRGTKTYGVSALEMKNMDFERIPLSFGNTEQHLKCVKYYKSFTDWHNSDSNDFKEKVNHFTAILNEDKDVLNELDIVKEDYRNTHKFVKSVKSGLPIFTVINTKNVSKEPSFKTVIENGQGANVTDRKFGTKYMVSKIKYINLMITLSNKAHVFVQVHFVPPPPINMNARAPATSQAMATYRTVMAPFGAAAQRKLYPCSDASLVAAVAARYQQVTGQKLALRPNVDVGTLIRRNNTIPSGYDKKQKVSAQPPAAVKAHPLSGCSGNLIQAIQALRIGPHMDGTDKMQDDSSYVFRNNSAEDVQKTVKLARKIHHHVQHSGLLLTNDLLEDHMKVIEDFAKEKSNQNHAVTLAWNTYNQSDKNEQDHKTLMNRIHHVLKEAVGMLNHSKKSVEEFGTREFKKARTFLEGVKKKAGEKLSNIEKIIVKTHKDLQRDADTDVEFSRLMRERRGMI